MRFEDLKFVRVNSFGRIPRYLFEQVEGRSWSVERLYRLAPSSGGANYFWAIEDEHRAVKGVLWVVLDVLSEKLNVIVFSVAQEYQENSLKNARDFLRRFIKDYNDIKLKERINWVTSQPEKFDEIGGRIPKTIMIEV